MRPDEIDRMTFSQLRLYGEEKRPDSLEEAIEIAKKQREAKGMG